MFAIWNTMKLQHGNAPVVRLIHGSLEVLQGPIRTRVAGGGDQKRVIHARLISKAMAPFVRMLGRATSTGEADSELL